MLPYIDETEMTVTNNDPSVVTRSRSGRKVTRNLEQQRWEAAVTWPDYLDDKALVIEIALDAMKGQSIESDIVHPVRSYHELAGDDWQVQSAAEAGDSSIKITGTGELTVGHYMVFSGHSKMYRVMAYVEGVVDIYPQLRSTVFETESVITQAVPISVTRTDDAISYKRTGPLTSLSANFEETL